MNNLKQLMDEHNLTLKDVKTLLDGHVQPGTVVSWYYNQRNCPSIYIEYIKLLRGEK